MIISLVEFKAELETIGACHQCLLQLQPCQATSPGQTHLVRNTLYCNLVNLLNFLSAPGWPSNNAFGIIGGPNRPHASRPVTIRLLISQACKQLTVNSLTKNSNGFHDVHSVLRQVEQMKPANEGSIQVGELLEICETEGNAQNGGGSFIVQNEPQRGVYVKFEPDDNTLRGSAPGEIGSPLPSHVFPTYGAPRTFPPNMSITSPTSY